MTSIDQEHREQFFADVARASARAVWCALATVAGSGAAAAPRVRMVHPTWEGQVLWLATAPDSPKARQLRANPRVDVQFQVAPPDFVHVLVRGSAELLSDDASRAHCWNVLDYDLAGFFPGGPTDPNYVAIRITPSRVELSEMFGSTNKRVWRA